VVLTKRWGRPAVPLLVFTAWQLCVAGLLLAPLALVLEGPLPRLTAANGVGFAYLGVVGTAVAYALWFRGLERLTASSASFLVLLSPTVAAALGLLVLGETFTPGQLLGALLVFCGVLLGQFAGGEGGTGAAARPGDRPRGKGETVRAEA
jgi:probable blue pigment (indigoidine) exporter